MTPATSSPAVPAQLDVVFDGTWVVVPSVDSTDKIISVDVYSPACGHPHGVYFTNGLNPNPWPTQSAFYMLDSHSYILAIQRGSRGPAGIPASGIDKAINHVLTVPRPISFKWDLLISIPLGPDAWVSGDTIVPQTTDAHGNVVNCFSGRDAPNGKISSMQTLRFNGVTGVDFLGAPASVQALFPAPWNGSGTMVFEDEVPYIPTLQHERVAIFAMADLAGADLALEFPLPAVPPPGPAPVGPPRPRLHEGGFCGHTLIVGPGTA
jgi:hypothetical protein